MTKEESTIIVNFMTSGAGVLVLGRGHISRIVKNALFLVFSTLVHDSDKLSHGNDDHGIYTKLINPPVRGLVLGRRHTSHIVEYIISFRIFI